MDEETMPPPAPNLGQAVGDELATERVPESDASVVSPGIDSSAERIPVGDALVAEPGDTSLDTLDAREAASSQVDLIEAIHALEVSVCRQLAELKGSIDRELRAEAAREKVVDRLHAELQEYKQDLLLRMLRPIFLDLIQLHDDVGKILDAHTAVVPTDGGEPCPPGRGWDTATRLVEMMGGVRQGIEDILYRQGVEPFATEDEDFDARRQRAVATVPTDDPERAKTVAGRLRSGFRAGERVIRPEIVSVYTVSRGLEA